MLVWCNNSSLECSKISLQTDRWPAKHRASLSDQLQMVGIPGNDLCIIPIKDRFPFLMLPIPSFLHWIWRIDEHIAPRETLIHRWFFEEECIMLWVISGYVDHDFSSPGCVTRYGWHRNLHQLLKPQLQVYLLNPRGICRVRLHLYTFGCPWGAAEHPEHHCVYEIWLSEQHFDISGSACRERHDVLVICGAHESSPMPAQKDWPLEVCVFLLWGIRLPTSGQHLWNHQQLGHCCSCPWSMHPHWAVKILHPSLNDVLLLPEVHCHCNHCWVFSH